MLNRRTVWVPALTVLLAAIQAGRPYITDPQVLGLLAVIIAVVNYLLHPTESQGIDSGSGTTSTQENP
jgi:hypothetical protein